MNWHISSIKNSAYSQSAQINLEIFQELKNKLESLLPEEKQMVINTHIEIMKQGLINEGGTKWTDAYLPKIKEQAEQYFNETFKQ